MTAPVPAPANVAVFAQRVTRTFTGRVLVLSEGTITIDLQVRLDRPRDRGHAEFTALRTRLLTELGVSDG
jgi:hypothetical protein